MAIGLNILAGLFIFFITWLFIMVIRNLYLRHHMRIFLGADQLEVYKRFQDGSIKDYLRSKYTEKEELMAYKVLRFLKNKLADEDDEIERSFLEEFINLFKDDGEEYDWNISEYLEEEGEAFFIRVFGRFIKVWGKGKINKKVMLEIRFSYEYKNGMLDQQYTICDLPASIIEEVILLNKCYKLLYEV